MKEVLEVALKDKSSLMPLPLMYLIGSKVLGAGVVVLLSLPQSGCPFPIAITSPLFTPTSYIGNSLLQKG